MNPSNEQMSLEQNNSGKGPGYPLPPGVAGWSWGACLLNWIWAIGNHVWIGLLALIPYAGVIITIVLGYKGREWAWQNKRWENIEHFNRVQRLWSIWGLILVFGLCGLGILAAILIPIILMRTGHHHPMQELLTL